MQDHHANQLNDGTAPRRLDIGPWISAVLERIWLVFIIALGITVGGIFFALKQVDTYRATAVINVAPEEIRVLSNVDDVTRDDFRGVEALNTVALRLRHRNTLLRVVRAHNLTNHPVFARENELEITKTFLKKSFSYLGGGTKTEGGVVVNSISPTEDQVLARLTKMIQTRLRPSTRLIEITVDHSDRELTALVANAVPAAFIRENINEKLSINDSANEALKERAKEVASEVEIAERKLLEYKKRNKATSLEDQQNVVQEAYKKANADFLAAKAERLAVETDLKAMEGAKADPDVLLALPSVRKDTAIQSMYASLLEKQTTVASMTNRYKPKYPKMDQALQQLRDMEASFKQLVLNSQDSVKAAYEAAKAKEESFAAAFGEAEKATIELNNLAVDYQVLVRQRDTVKASYDSLLKRIKETDIAKGLEKNPISIAETAAAPSKPYKPNRPMIVFLSFVAGITAGLGLVFFLGYLDNSIKTVDQAEEFLGLPVIGSVPMDKAAFKAHSRKALIEEPHSSCAEAYRSLVAAIDMAGRIEDQRVVLFTSAIPGEGKTFSSVNYSVGHAQKGRKTLLIDFDLRRPSVGDSFGINKEQPGVTDFLLGKATLDQLAIPVPEVPNLFVLPAGPLVPNPAEQLSRPWLNELMEEATKKYDRVVLDTAPLNAVADAVYLLKFAKVIGLVVRAGKTPIRAIRRAIQILERSNARVSGLVLNCLPERGGYGYYYYYYSGDKYNSKGVYGAPGPERNGSTKPAKRRSAAVPEESA